MKRKNIAAAVIIGISNITAYLLLQRQFKKKLEESKALVQKNDQIIRAFERWMKLKQSGKSIATFLQQSGYSHVAIYGFGKLGTCLYEELRDSKVKVDYIIDKNPDVISVEVDKYPVGVELPDTEMIIVTSIAFFNQVQDEVIDYCRCPIFSLEDILQEMALA